MKGAGVDIGSSNNVGGKTLWFLWQISLTQLELELQGGERRYPSTNSTGVREGRQGWGLW